MWFGFLLLLLELWFLPEDVSHVGWMAHCLHEQVDIVWPIIKIIEGLKIVKALHEFVKILIKQWIRKVMRSFWSLVARGIRRASLVGPWDRLSHPIKLGVSFLEFHMGLCCHVLLLGVSSLEGVFSHLDASVSAESTRSNTNKISPVRACCRLGCSVACVGLPKSRFHKLDGSRYGSWNPIYSVE